MAFTDKGTISNNALSIAFASENPVKAKLASPYVLVTFSTDLADGAEGSIVLTFDSVSPATGGSFQATHKQIKWPSTVKWEQGIQPTPRGYAGDVAHFKFIRDAAVGYIGRLVVSGAA